MNRVAETSRIADYEEDRTGVPSMLNVVFKAMATAEVHALQAGGLDANGQRPERHVSDGDGVPCRHCQCDVAEGEPYLILSYRPFSEPQPYAETGPIFLHAEPCERYVESTEIPAMFHRNNRRYLLKGYNERDRIVYGTGTIVSPDELPVAAERILSREDVRYVHVRSATNNCYQLRMERA
jgi:hypothetical protein